MAQTMVSPKSVILSIAWLAFRVASQGNAGESIARGPDAFTYVQPIDTAILGQYGHVPAVPPSRMFLPCHPTMPKTHY